MIFCGFNFCLFVQMQNIFTFWCIFQPLGWLFKILKFQIFQVLLKLVLDLLRLLLVLYSIFVCNICLPKAYLQVLSLLYLVILSSTNYCCLALSIFANFLLFWLSWIPPTTAVWLYQSSHCYFYLVIWISSNCNGWPSHFSPFELRQLLLFGFLAQLYYLRFPEMTLSTS